MVSGASASRSSRSRAINVFLGSFFLGGTGESLVNFLQIGEVESCFILNRGRVTVCLARKNYSMSLLFCIYKESYQSRLI